MRMGDVKGRGCQAYLSKVYFVKDHLVRMANANEPGDEGENGDDSKGNLVIPVFWSLFLLELQILDV